MGRKIGVLFVILFLISAVAYVLFWNDIIDAFTSNRSKDISYHSLSIDRKNNIYFIMENKSKNYLVKSDYSGEVIYLKEILPDTETDSEYVSDVYIDYSGNIFVVKYQIQKNEGLIVSVCMKSYKEDGTLVGEVFRRNINARLNLLDEGIINICEDGKSIYFGYLKKNIIEEFVFNNQDISAVKKVKEFELAPDAEVSAAQFLPPEDIIVSLKKGLLYRTSSNGAIYTYDTKDLGNIIIEKIWLKENGEINLFDGYARRLLAISPKSQTPTILLKDSSLINEKDSFKEIAGINMELTGNMIGVQKIGSELAVLAGGLTYMKKVGLLVEDEGRNLKGWLILFAVVAGCIILSILIWDFYYNIAKMKTSILLKQALVVAFSILAMLYLLKVFIIEPALIKFIDNQYRLNLTTAVEIAKRNINIADVDAVKGPGDYDNEAYRRLEKVLGLAGEGGQNAESNLPNILELHIFAFRNNRFESVVSADGYVTGYPLDYNEFEKNFVTNLKEVSTTKQNIFGQISEPAGSLFCLFTPLSIDKNHSYFLVASVNTEKMDEIIASVNDRIDKFLFISGAAMGIILILFFSMVVYGLRKLKKGVEQIGAGNYGFEIEIKSGDEIQDLAETFNYMSKFIGQNTKRLKGLNQSYFRFVPESFIRMLGEESIENVGQGSYVKKTMTMMYMKVKDFKKLTLKYDTEQIFGIINEIFGALAPVVNDFEGTIYTFHDTGFMAVFPNEPERALNTSFRIREVLADLNHRRQTEGKEPVDIRIVLHKDDVMLGVVGDEKRMTAQVISESTNLINEIMKICEERDVYILCTENVSSEIEKELYKSRYIGVYEGNTGSVKMFDFFGSDPYGMMKAKEIFLEPYRKAVELFEKGDFHGARRSFMEVVKKAPEDGVARNYLYRANTYANQESAKQNAQSTLG